MIEFVKIHIQGFGSIIEPLTYQLNTPGLNIITGDNGAGKTTIFNALSWCLYKQLLKKNSTFEPWPHLIDKTFKGTRVVVKFRKDGDNYDVERLSDYSESGKKRISGIIIRKNGEALPDRDKKDLQNKIVEILGYSFELFKSAILFGQELNRMMKEDGPTKKRILEETFNLTFIQKAKEVVDKRIIPLRQELGKLEVEIQAKATLRDTLLSEIKNYERAKLDFELQVKETIADLMERISEKKKKIPQKINTKELVEQHHKLEKEMEELKTTFETEWANKEFQMSMNISGLRSDIEAKKRKLVDIRESFNKAPKACPTCNTPFSEEKRNRYVEEAKEKYTNIKSLIKKDEAQLEILEKEYQKVKKKLDKQEALRIKIDQLKGQIFLLSGQIKRAYENNSKRRLLKKEIEGLQESIEREKARTFSMDITETKGKLEEVNLAINECETRLNKLRKYVGIDEWLIKDPLSNGGLKAFIFESLISQVNRALSKLVPLVGFKIRLYIDLESARKDLQIAVYRKDNEVPYEDLSGGQKQLSDIALILAVQDVISSTKPVNIMLFDEVFESLSENNIEAVSNILQERAKTRCIHLITHLSKFTPLSTKFTYLELTDAEHTKISL